MSERKLVTIICPVHNEEDSIRPFYGRVADVFKKLDHHDFELIFTNNRSTDATPARILELRREDPRVQLLTFSRNYVYQYSVLAGMLQPVGDAIVTIELDCED